MVRSVLAGILLLSAPAATAQGRPNGELRHDERAIAIVHASARQVEMTRDWLADDQVARSIKVLLADRAPSAAAAAGESGFMEAADAGELNSLVVQITLPDHRWSTLAISGPGGEGPPTTRKRARCWSRLASSSYRATSCAPRSSAWRFMTAMPSWFALLGDGGTILTVEPDNGGWRVGRQRRPDD